MLLGVIVVKRTWCWSLAVVCLLLSPWSLSPVLVADEPSDEAKAHYGAGMVDKKAGNYAAAIAEFQKAVEVTPGYVDAWWGLAWSCVAAEEQQDAIEAFGHVVELAPGTDRSRGARAALQRLGDAPPPGAPQSGPGPGPDAEPDGPAVFVKEGGKLFHCDHGCPSIHTRLMGVRRKPYPNPLAAAREGSRPCPKCRPVPEGMMAAVREVLAETERKSKRPQPVTCDRFEVKVEWQKPGKELVVSLDTDLPNEAVVSVNVGRTFRYEGGSDHVAYYCSQDSTVGYWRTPRLVYLENQTWEDGVREQVWQRMLLNAEIRRLAARLEEPALVGAELSTTVDAVSSRVQVTAIFHARQPNTRVFSKGNRNVSGGALVALSRHDPDIRIVMRYRTWFSGEAGRLLRDAEHHLAHGDDYYAKDDVVFACPYRGLYPDSRDWY